MILNYIISNFNFILQKLIALFLFFQISLNQLQKALPSLVKNSKNKQDISCIKDLPQNNIYHQDQNQNYKQQKPEPSALFILAGGAATRLGADCPKGLYPIDIKPYTCILESLFAQMIQYNKKYNIITPIILMLSEATKNTMNELKDKNYFNYPKEYIFAELQDTYNVFDINYQPLLQNKNEYLLSPNGNGGFLGVFGKIYEQNKQIFDQIKYIHCISVDNPFVKCCDEEMINFASQNKLQVVNRVLEVTEFNNCGIMGQKIIDINDQAPLVAKEYKQMVSDLIQKPCMSVFEYSEIKEFQSQKAYANIANHLFSVEFLVKLQNLRKIVQSEITPYHLAFKAVNYFDPNTNQQVIAQKQNAYKIEHFIFDIFTYCPINQFGIFICDKSQFLPLKKKEDKQIIENQWKISNV